MAYLCIDTETTGLPLNNVRDYKNTVAFDTCRLVSVAVVLYSPEHEELSHFYELIKPEGFQVTATEIHGITHEDAETRGVPFVDVYERLYKLIESFGIVLGYNLSFDMNVIKSEAWRRDLNMLKPCHEICAFKLAKQVLGRSVRLGALYKEFSGKDLEGWHGALEDARATSYVYNKLLGVKPTEHSSIKSKRIIIKASDVAACIGKHQYKKKSEVLDDMWKRYSPETFTGQTKTDKALEIIAKSDETRKVLETAVSSKADVSTDTQTIVKAAAEKIKESTNLTQNEKREVLDHIRSQVYTSFGTKSEDKTADRVGNLTRDDNFYEVPVAEFQGTKYVIVGKIDRIDEATGTLIEIKNRARGLFNHVKLYELIQVQVYLEMLNLENARLVEQFNDEISSSDIKRDRDLWNTVIMPKLVSFCSELHSKMSV